MTRLKCIFCGKKIKDYWALLKHLNANHSKNVILEWLKHDLNKFWDEGTSIGERKNEKM